MAFERPPYGLPAESETPRLEPVTKPVESPRYKEDSVRQDQDRSAKLRGSQDLPPAPAMPPAPNLPPASVAPPPAAPQADQNDIVRNGNGQDSTRTPVRGRDWRTLAEKASEEAKTEWHRGQSDNAPVAGAGGWPQAQQTAPSPLPRETSSGLPPHNISSDATPPGRGPAPVFDATMDPYSDMYQAPKDPAPAVAGAPLEPAMTPTASPPYDDAGRAVYADGGGYSPDTMVAEGGIGNEPHPHDEIRREDAQQGVFDDMYEEAEPPKRRRPALLLGMLAGVAVVAGGLIFAFQFSKRGDGGADVPVVEADKGPAKVAPNDPGGVKIPKQTKLIYQRIVGNKIVEAERVVPREEPVKPLAPASGDQGAAEPSGGAGTQVAGGSGSSLEEKLKDIVPAGGTSIVSPTTGGSVVPATSTKGKVEVSPLLPLGSTPPATAKSAASPPPGTLKSAASGASDASAIARPPVPRLKPKPPAPRKPIAAKPQKLAGGPIRLTPGGTPAPTPRARASAPRALAPPPAPQPLTPTRVAAAPPSSGPVQLISPNQPATTNLTGKTRRARQRRHPLPRRRRRHRERSRPADPMLCRSRRCGRNRRRPPGCRQ